MQTLNEIMLGIVCSKPVSFDEQTMFGIEHPFVLNNYMSIADEFAFALRTEMMDEWRNVLNNPHRKDEDKEYVASIFITSLTDNLGETK